MLTVVGQHRYEGFHHSRRLTCAREGALGSFFPEYFLKERLGSHTCSGMLCRKEAWVSVMPTWEEREPEASLGGGGGLWLLLWATEGVGWGQGPQV